MAGGAGMSMRVDVRVEPDTGGDFRVSWTDAGGSRFVAVGQCTVWRLASGDLVRDYGLIDWLSKQAWLHEKAAERAGKEKS